MIYFFSGDKFQEVKKSSQELIEKLVKDRPDSSVLQINEENFGEYELSGLSKEQGLFEKQLIVVLNYLISAESVWENIQAKLQEMAESKNIFILVEGPLDKRIRDKIGKTAKESKNFSTEEKEKYNPFLLTDAYGAKNKKKLWVLYQQAILNGSAPEEIHGLLFWQVKSMLVAKLSASPVESGLKPFVFQKSKTFGQNFSEIELKKHSNDLVKIYHDIRKGTGDMSTGLEKFILKI